MLIVPFALTQSCVSLLMLNVLLQWKLFCRPVMMTGMLRWRKCCLNVVLKSVCVWALMCCIPFWIVLCIASWRCFWRFCMFIVDVVFLGIRLLVLIGLAVCYLL